MPGGGGSLRGTFTTRQSPPLITCLKPHYLFKQRRVITPGIHDAPYDNYVFVIMYGEEYRVVFIEQPTITLVTELGVINQRTAFGIFIKRNYLSLDSRIVFACDPIGKSTRQVINDFSQIVFSDASRYDLENGH